MGDKMGAPEELNCTVSKSCERSIGMSDEDEEDDDEKINGNDDDDDDDDVRD